MRIGLSCNMSERIDSYPNLNPHLLSLFIPKSFHSQHLNHFILTTACPTNNKSGDTFNQLIIIEWKCALKIDIYSQYFKMFALFQYQPQWNTIIQMFYIEVS